MVLASTSAANAHQPRNAVRYADGTSSTIDTPGVLKFHRSTAIPDKASPWSAISLRSFCRLALVGCVAGDGCGPKLPSSTPSYPRSWSLCRMTWKSLVGLSWLNRYAQVPMDSRAFMESSLSRAVGDGATVLDGAAWRCQSCPRALRHVSSGMGGPEQGENSPTRGTFREAGVSPTGLTTLLDKNRAGGANPPVGLSAELRRNWP